MFIIMNCPAFVIILIYNNSIIISVIKRNGEDLFLRYSSLFLGQFYFIVGVFFLGGAGGGRIGSFFFQPQLHADLHFFLISPFCSPFSSFPPPPPPPPLRFIGLQWFVCECVCVCVGGGGGGVTRPTRHAYM